MTLDQMEELLNELEIEFKQVEEERRAARRIAESSPQARKAREGKNGRMRARAAETVAMTIEPYRSLRTESNKLRRRLNRARKAVEAAREEAEHGSERSPIQG